MINALVCLLFVTAWLHKLIYDWSYFYIYTMFFAAYLAYFFQNRVKRDNGKRKTLMFASWNEPGDPTGFMSENLNMTQAMEYLKKS
jgi:hypothetical protein